MTTTTTEQPEGEEQHVHALQIFVNLPACKKFNAPYAVHVEPHDIPEFEADGVRVRVVSGSSNGVSTGSDLKISTNVPPMISSAPIAFFQVSGSPKKTTAKTIANATLNLSTGATCDTSPNCNALK